MKKTVFLFFSFLMISTAANALVSLELSETQVPLGKAVQLTIQSDKEINPYSLSNEIAKKAKIRGQSSATNIQITNNSQSTLHTLSFTIFPLAEGETIFGPFDINQEKTNSVTLTVLPPEQLQQNTQEITKTNQNIQSTQSITSQLLFQAEANPKKIYEGQTGIYKLKLFDPINLYNINIQPPKNYHFIFSKLNHDTLKQEKINEKIGRLYQSYYTFTPVSAGKFQINSAEVSGNLPSKGNAKDIHSFFDMAFNDRFLISPFQNEIPVYYQSNPLEIEVKEKPKDWTGWWLPSINVSLTQEFKIPDKIHLGEAIERKITLKAIGIEPSKLPTLTHAASEDYSFFANPEQRYFLFENEEIIGVETQEFLIIPQKEGIIKLPPLKIKYFNTETEEEKIIQVEGKEITVLPALLTSNSVKEETPPSPTQKEPIKKEKPTLKKSTDSPLLWITIICGVILLTILMALLLKYKKKKNFSPIENIETEVKEKKKKKPLPDLYPF
ncbi:MAG: BatD family protein [Alphaproteobacteria bacterium]|nr:BatD family protein [Alphaproteobacteria bacterium]